MPHIQVPEDSSNARAVSVVGDTPISSLAFSFPFFETGDIKVYKDGAAVSSGFTVTGVGSAVDGGYSSGNVAFGTAQSNCTIVIERDVPLSRTEDLAYPSPTFNIKALNTALDRIVATFQQFRRLFLRTLRQPVGDTVELGELPLAAERANKFLGFDSTGALLAASPGTLALGTGDVTGDKIAAGAVDLSKLSPEVVAALGRGSEAIVAGEAIADRDLIYQDVFNQRGGGGDRWWKIDTDATGPVRIGPRVGIALAAISSGATGSAQVRPGRVAGFSGLTAGAPVFAGGTAGLLTQTAPTIPATGTQNASRLIGYAASATEIDFNPDDDTVFTARNSALAATSSITVQHWPDAGAAERVAAAYLAAPSLVPTGTFAIATAASRGVDSGNGINFGTSFVATVTGTIATTRINIPVVTTGGTYEARLYTNNAGSPGTLIGTASGAQVISATGDVTFTFGTPPSVTSGVTYWMVFANTAGAPVINVTTVADQAGYSSGRGNTITAITNNLPSSEDWKIEIIQNGPARHEPEPIFPESRFSASTDRVTGRFDDGSGANADTRTTFVNRTGATRDLAVEVAL